MTIQLTQTGVGTADTNKVIYDSTGTGQLPIQAHVTGAATFRVLGRVHDTAPWMEIIAAGTVDFLQSFNWLPWIRLEVTAGAGQVDLWIGEK